MGYRQKVLINCLVQMNHLLCGALSLLSHPDVLPAAGTTRQLKTPDDCVLCLHVFHQQTGCASCHECHGRKLQKVPQTCTLKQLRLWGFGFFLLTVASWFEDVRRSLELGG